MQANINLESAAEVVEEEAEMAGDLGKSVEVDPTLGEVVDQVCHVS